jgi:hypothetical protein
MAATAPILCRAAPSFLAQRSSAASSAWAASIPASASRSDMWSSALRTGCRHWQQGEPSEMCHGLAGTRPQWGHACLRTAGCSDASAAASSMGSHCAASYSARSWLPSTTCCSAAVTRPWKTSAMSAVPLPAPPQHPSCPGVCAQHQCKFEHVKRLPRAAPWGSCWRYCHK